MRRRLRQAGERPARVLVAGWFSFPRLGATAGDLLALEVTCGWLTEAGFAHDVAFDPTVGSGVDWRRVDPRAYSHLVFVCGPFYARRRLLRVLPRSAATAVSRAAPLLRRVGLARVDRIVLELLVRRFDRCRQIGLNLSMLGPERGWHPFAALVPRDGAHGPPRADLALAHQGGLVPVVGVVLVEQGVGNDDRRLLAARRAIDAVLADRSVAIVTIDTRLDRPNPGGLRTAAEVESLIARMDLVVTTRLHGAVLALKHGVPVVAVDVVDGGGKLTSQMSVLGWPQVFDADTLDPAAFGRAFDDCLRPGARDDAVAAGRRGVTLAGTARGELLAALDPSGSAAGAAPPPEPRR